jgi:hypothetical protein
MNDQDLRDALGIMITAGFVTKYGKDWSPEDVWEIADLVVEARKPKEIEEGIVAIKKRVRKS